MIRNINLSYAIRFITVIISLYIGFRLQNYKNNSLDAECSKLSIEIENASYLKCIKKRNLKSVQLLNNFFQFKNWAYEDLGEKPFENCKLERRCYAFQYTAEANTPLEESDGVILHGPNLINMPSRVNYNRNRRQLWSYYSMEPSRMSYCLFKGNITDLDDWFNLTQTIKTHKYFTTNLKQLNQNRDYYYTFEKDSHLIPTPSELYKAKKGLVVWFVSRCTTPNKRELFVQELAKYIPIDIYGKCGAKKDPCIGSDDPHQCLTQLYNSYKFYLSFENCNCDSYITEKYFKFYRTDSIFRVNVVPIVMGARIDQYEKMAPISDTQKASFIHVDSFQSNAKQLAEYLIYLDRNEDAYMEFYQWKFELVHRFSDLQKTFFTIGHFLEDEYDTPFCNLCAHLHNETFLKEKKEGIKMSEYFNFMKDCDNQNEKGELSFDALKNNCYYFGESDSDKWKL